MQTPPNLNFKISRIGQPDPVSKGKDRKGRKPAAASIERFRERREQTSHGRASERLRGKEEKGLLAHACMHVISHRFLE